MLLSPIGFSPPPILGLKRLDISTVNSPPPPPSPIVKMDGDELIASVYRKIEREKALITAATNMRSSTDNPLVQQRVDANIRDGRKNIAYLEEKMQELQLRRIEHDGGGGSPTESRQQYGAGSASGPVPPPKDYSPGYMGNNPSEGVLDLTQNPLRRIIPRDTWEMSRGILVMVLVAFRKEEQALCHRALPIRTPVRLLRCLRRDRIIRSLVCSLVAEKSREVMK